MQATRSRTSTTSDVWLTPKYIIDDIGPFDLDPCTEKERPWPTAESHFTLIDDGLMQDWFCLVQPFIRFTNSTLVEKNG